MDIRQYDGNEPKISDIRVHTSSGRVTLQFMWPNELEILYIYKANLLKGENVDYDKPYKKYTKNEYSSFGGFTDDKGEGGVIKYVLCPCIKEGQEEYLVQYEDGCNEVQVTASRIEIRYELQEKKKLLSPRKLVLMKVFCEAGLPKEFLCYVKKKGTIPVSPSDGMCFQFIDDFHGGDNILPEIEVDKDEYVRIYLAEDVPYKEAYRVIKG